MSRPLRPTGDGFAVTYRRRLWPLLDGAIHLDGPATEIAPAAEPIEVEPAAESDDGAQQGIIDGPAERRVRVDAGPGTGKTWTACARAAALLEQGVPPSRLWIISFTRTAVLEIRSRIAAALPDPGDAASLKILTLDAYAWSLQSGFDADAVLTGSHDDNIARTLVRVQTDQDLQDYLQRVRHLIVDEAQDIVGIRAELVSAIIAALPPECGVSVFSDPAQAIYGFTEEESASPGAPSLLERLPGDFEQAALTQVRRTSCPKLKELFSRTRRRVLANGSVSTRAEQLRSDLRRLSHHALEPARDGGVSTLSADGLVLFRRRAEVISASSYAGDMPHRLRMSGLPVPVQPWIGLLFWDWTDRRIGRSDFDHLWSQRMAASDTGREMAWTRLVEAAGESLDVVDLHRLRSLLARPGPPLLFSTPEFGEDGPIVGTIHASKGREAEHVALWIPEPEAETTDEEVRVLFVGGTRARTTLSVGDARVVHARSLAGRVWRRVGNGVQVEVGRVGDIGIEGLAGADVFADAAAVQIAQNHLRQAPRQKDMVVCSRGDLDWRLAIQAADRTLLGVMTESLQSDLRSIANECKQWPPPSFLPYVRSVGLRTLAVRPDDPVLERLHEPWRSSGFAVAPLLIGFPTGRFPRKNA